MDTEREIIEIESKIYICKKSVSLYILENEPSNYIKFKKGKEYYIEDGDDNPYGDQNQFFKLAYKDLMYYVSLLSYDFYEIFYDEAELRKLKIKNLLSE